jgi:DNA-binding MarR family transcriptional regulator
MTPDELTAIVLEWSTTFIRLSLHDFNHYTRSAGLSMAQMTVLMHLYYQGPNEVSKVCEMMQLTRPGASQMIERMVQQGVVERTEIPGDRRVRMVGLTDQGRKVVEESIAARQAWIEKLVSGLSAAETERVAEALRILNDHTGHLEIRPAG